METLQQSGAPMDLVLLKPLRSEPRLPRKYERNSWQMGAGDRRVEWIRGGVCNALGREKGEPGIGGAPHGANGEIGGAASAEASRKRRRRRNRSLRSGRRR